MVCKVKCKYEVTKIEPKKTEEWLLNKHYSKRKCNIMESFGLIDNYEIVGVCTFGMPPTPFMESLFGKGNYIELNRLITNDGLEKNVLSFFVASSIKRLGNRVVVSYADPNSGHNGYIYQATNFVYTGKGRVNQEDKRGVNRFFYNDTEYHERHIPETMNRLKFSIDVSETKNQNWKDNGGLVVAQKRKHRYFFVNGSKGFKKRNMNIIKNHFKIYPYPKDKNEEYDASYEVSDRYVTSTLFNYEQMKKVLR